MIIGITLAAIIAYVIYASLNKPGVFLVLIFSMFAIEQVLQANYHIFIQRGYLFNVLVGATALTLIVKLVLRYGIATQTITREEFLVYVLYFYAFISVFWSVDSAGSLERYIDKFPYIVLFIFLAPRFITSLSSVTDMMPLQVMVGGILTIVMLATLEWEGRELYLDDNITGNPLAVAEMAGYTALCAALYKKNNKYDIGMLALRVIVICLCFIVIIKSGSRGQLFAAMLSLIVCWPLSFKTKNIAGFLSLIFLSIVLINFASIVLEQIWGGGKRYDIEQMGHDMGGRFDMAATMLSEVMSNPISILFGLGNGASFAIIGFYPHIVPLEIISEEGLIGFTIYLTILFYAVKNIIKLNRLLKNNYNKLKRAGAVLTAFLLLLFLLSLKQGDLISSVTFFLTTIMLARYTRMIEISINHAHRQRLAKQATLSRE